MDFKENPQDIKPPYRYINTSGTKKAVSRLSFLFADLEEERGENYGQT
nr:MAG TPA: hypothetical protein [Caudoviricetes sp.]